MRPIGTKLKEWSKGYDYPKEFFEPLNIFDALDDGNWKAVGDFFTKNPVFLDYYYCERSLLHIFAEYDYPQLLEIAVQLGMDVNVEEEANPEGALCVAVRTGNLKSAEWLLKHGARASHQIDGLTYSGGTLSAVASGELEMVKLLVEHGEPLNVLVDNPPRSLLTTAIQLGQTKVADYLRSKGALTEDEIKARDAKGKPKRKK